MYVIKNMEAGKKRLSTLKKYSVALYVEHELLKKLQHAYIEFYDSLISAPGPASVAGPYRSGSAQ
jgi:hypothetical protein